MLMKKCDNCYIYQVTKTPKCFATWCHRCDWSLWQTRPLSMVAHTDICFGLQDRNTHTGNLICNN